MSFDLHQPFVLEAVPHSHRPSFSSREGGRYVTCSRTHVEWRVLPAWATGDLQGKITAVKLTWEEWVTLGEAEVCSRWKKS